jgi:antitoxin VapB
MYIQRLVLVMKTAKVFKSGNSQAVRIPREFLIHAEEVEIRKRGDAIVLRPKTRSWKTLIESLDKFSDDFMGDERKQPPMDKRSKAF